MIKKNHGPLVNSTICQVKHSRAARKAFRHMVYVENKKAIEVDKRHVEKCRNFRRKKVVKFRYSSSGNGNLCTCRGSTISDFCRSW